MCGRFTLTAEESAIRTTFGVEPGDLSWRLRYNIAPGQAVLAILGDTYARRMGYLRWGLVPPWASEGKAPRSTFNARAETLMQQHTWKRLVPQRRCLIPSDGWYEWARESRQPYRIHLTTRPLFGFAGLWDTWVAKDGPERIDSCTIITCAMSPSLAALHDRMPVVLRPPDVNLWLDSDIREPDRLLPLLHPYPDAALRAYPVAKTVGNVRIDQPACIVEVAGA